MQSIYYDIKCSIKIIYLLVCACLQNICNEYTPLYNYKLFLLTFVLSNMIMNVVGVQLMSIIQDCE